MNQQQSPFSSGSSRDPATSNIKGNFLNDESLSVNYLGSDVPNTGEKSDNQIYTPLYDPLITRPRSSKK